MAQPRLAQAEVLRYRSGRMGVAAVPGSGKTWTLSQLAADLIASNQLADNQEVLIVTLVNSAVDNSRCALPPRSLRFWETASTRASKRDDRRRSAGARHFPFHRFASSPGTIWRRSSS